MDDEVDAIVSCLGFFVGDGDGEYSSVLSRLAVLSPSMAVSDRCLGWTCGFFLSEGGDMDEPSLRKSSLIGFFADFSLSSRRRLHMRHTKWKVSSSAASLDSPRHARCCQTLHSSQEMIPDPSSYIYLISSRSL